MEFWLAQKANTKMQKKSVHNRDKATLKNLVLTFLKFQQPTIAMLINLSYN